MAEQKKPKCPKCEGTAFELVSEEDFFMSFICCSSCGTVIAYRDSLLLDKLDRVAEALEYND
jgi:transcription initiation factor TFIIIB Brf1 subunit/transcription initiation factor TFIIB